MGNVCQRDLNDNGKIQNFVARFVEIARKHDLFVLEDCCQALGASYKGQKVGSFGDMGAFSLNINKTITAGDGGWVACLQQYGSDP